MEKSDMFIVDERFSLDPNMKIYNSYLVTRLDDIEEVLDVMEAYEETYPSSFERSRESMKMEWVFYNLLYFCDSRKLIRSVNFSNLDGIVYDSPVLKKILK